MIKTVLNKKFYFILILLISYSTIWGQHRGDDIDFQGLELFNDTGVRATGMGGAVTSLSGDVSYMFYNPAGINSIKSIQATVSGTYKNFYWRENQNYRPNRYFVTLPFYLEGLYTPDPAEDGMYDYQRLWTEDQLIDSTYVVNAPVLGLDPYSEEAADWEETKTDVNFNNLAVAVPLNLFDESFVVSLGYNNRINIENFDRNDTYLDPHLGYKEYGPIGRVNGTDSLIVKWSKYKRSRSGRIDNIALALAYDLSAVVKLGLGFNYSWGSSEDHISLDRVGTFHLIKQQRFKYWFADGYNESKGTSNYSSAQFNLGLQIKLEKFNIGVKVDLPYTLERKWDYRVNYKDSTEQSSSNQNGIDKLKYPAIFDFGASFIPVDNFIVSIDYEYAPLSKATFNLSDNGKYHYNWIDRHTIRVGAAYTPIELLTILLGYRSIPQVFIPDGAAINDAGPKANSYTVGLSFNTSLGRFDVSYEYRNLKYYDSYYSNTNYNTIENNNIFFGYTLNIL